MLTEAQPGPSRPEVELIGGKIFSVQHANGHLLATVAYSELGSEALSHEIKALCPESKDIRTHPIGSATLLIVGAEEEMTYYSLEKPFVTGSEGSESVYVAVAKFEDCTFLVQSNRPNSRASWHWHSPGEHFLNRDGNSFIYEDGEKISKVGTYRYVRPNTPHLIFTLDRRAINLILHEGTNLKHNPIPKPRPSIEELRNFTIKAGLYPSD